MAKKAVVSPIAVGEHVRLKTFLANLHQTYQVNDSQLAFRREAVNGLVMSIRDIKTGHLVAATDGKTQGYVFELLFDNTFSSRYASIRNAPRNVERATATPAWQRIRETLRELATKEELVSTSTPGFMIDSPFSKLLDGWKVVKVRADELESLETPTEE